VIRCLALAERISALGHLVSFACLALEGNLNAKIVSSGFELIEAPTEADPGTWIPERNQYDVCVIDRYDLDYLYESKLRSVAKGIIAIDDWGARKHDANAIIDPSISSGTLARRQMNPGVPFHSGPEWVLLRREFARLNTTATERTAFKKVLVFFGGTDPTDQMIRYYEEISKRPMPLEFHFLISSHHPRLSEFRSLHDSPTCQIDIAPSNMADYLSGMDLYLGSAGTISWERMCVGVTGLVVSIVPNQVDLARTLDGMGLHRYLGSSDAISATDALTKLVSELDHSERLSEMSRRSIALIDGNGCERVARIINIESEE